MVSSGVEAYKLGRHYTMLPIPMDPEHCVDVPAGPITFVVEARWLTPDRVLDHAASLGRLADIDDVSGVDDSGLTVHVLDTAGRREHLRFDCFEHEPHYHYVHDADAANTVVRIDDVAEGDASAWMLRTLRRRLPEMLAHAGVPDIGEAVRADAEQVSAAIDTVEALVVDAARSAGGDSAG